MKPATKILRLVQPENGGPRLKRILEGMATHYGAPASLVDEMIADGRLRKYGDRKGATWDLPRKPGRPRAERRA